MKRVLHLIPKATGIAVMATIAWFVYTHMLATVTPEAADNAPWVSGYSLTEKSNTMVNPKETDRKTAKEETSSKETDSTMSTVKQPK